MVIYVVIDISILNVYTAVSDIKYECAASRDTASKIDKTCSIDLSKSISCKYVSSCPVKIEHLLNIILNLFI